MKNILVIGGTRYFGKRLVRLLLDQKAHITLVSRGLTPHPFGNLIEHIKVNREDEAAFANALRGRSFDMIYDQMCYHPSEARQSIRLFSGKVEHYILTSTMAVYHSLGGEDLTEENFDPYTYPISSASDSAFDYAESKRQAEAIFFQQANFKVTAIRFPIVLGADDYTNRLEFHINQIHFGQPFSAANLQIQLCFIHSQEAAAFLSWCGQQTQVLGPINACSLDSISFQKLIELLESKLNKKAMIQLEAKGQNLSPFSRRNSLTINTDKAQKSGFLFQSLHDWLPVLIDERIQFTACTDFPFLAHSSPF